jgi:predicted HicB family RNase H-like nuclease
MANINIRDFPDTLHRGAKSKAALEGISLKELIIKAVDLYLKKGVKGKKSTG